MIDPSSSTLESWASSLIIDFPTDDIPVLFDGDWRSFGDALAQCESFSEGGCTGTHNFDDWLSYAISVYQTMINF